MGVGCARGLRVIAFNRHRSGDHRLASAGGHERDLLAADVAGVQSQKPPVSQYRYALWGTSSDDNSDGRADARMIVRARVPASWSASSNGVRCA
jgi:hypothetical protein